MNSSYLAVPGRGGASGGRPPVHCGRVSVIPAASLSLMLPQPPSVHAGSPTAAMMARWRMLTGICEASRSLGDGSASYSLKRQIGLSARRGYVNTSSLQRLMGWIDDTL